MREEIFMRALFRAAWRARRQLLGSIVLEPCRLSRRNERGKKADRTYPLVPPAEIPVRQFVSLFR